MTGIIAVAAIAVCTSVPVGSSPGRRSPTPRPTNPAGGRVSSPCGEIDAEQPLSYDANQRGNHETKADSSGTRSCT